VNVIWESYDINKNNVLDKEEAFEFLRDTLQDMGEDSGIFTKQEIEKTFNDIDKN
jgi:hypothetical protein